MFDNNVFKEATCKNIEEKGEVIGFELQTLITYYRGIYKWDNGEPLYIRVLKPGGLSTGDHQVKLTVATRTAYIPVPLVGVKERTVTI